MMKTFNINKSKNASETWDYCSEYINYHTDYHHNQEGVELLHGYPWPPRSYKCNFCKREFKSAQALGGHMNVHRRERARLRQYSPIKEHGQCTTLLNLNVEPSNPNPNLVSSSNSLKKFPPVITPTLKTSFSSSTTPTELKTWCKSKGDICNIKNLNASKNVEFSKKKVGKTLFRDEDLSYQEGFSVGNEGEIVALDLEIGLVRGKKKEELDLELRLGYT